MEDERLVSLYWERNEAALAETEKKYGPYLTQIAHNLLADWEDSRECVNDTYWKAWNSMPPHRPRVLRTYLGKITRQVSIDRLRKRGSRKRRFSAYTVSMSELEETVSAGDATAQLGIIDDVPQGNPVPGDFIGAPGVDIAGEADELGAAAVLRTKFQELFAAHGEDNRDARKGLHVVHQGGHGEEANLR